MADFATYLYIKQHAITGKCYFGKTTRDPLKYTGSGKHWQAHIKIHGIEHVETLWYKLFTDEEEIKRVALLFSEQQDIVNSDRWLNLIPENGIDGWKLGTKRSEETRKKMSIAKTGRIYSVESIQKMSIAKQNMSNETRAKMSASSKGKILSAETKAKIAASVKRSRQEKLNAK